MLYVKSEKSETRININKISAAQKIVDTYVIILKSDRVLNDVIDSLNLDYTAKQIKKMISISSVNDTEVMQIQVTSPNAQLSCNIANKLAEIAPEKLVEITDAGFVKIVDSATVDPVPTSPDVRMNCLIGTFAGIALSVMYIIIRELFNVRVKSEEDIKKNYAIPVLGEIPSFNTHFKGGYGYGNYGQ